MNSFYYKFPPVNIENLLKNKKIKAVFFDMDGVLVDSMRFHLNSWKQLLETYNIRVSDQFIYEHEGAMGPEIIQTLLTENGYELDLENILDIYQQQNDIFLNQYLSKVSLFPDSLPLLENLKEKGLMLGLVTGSRRNLIERIWNSSDLDLFSTIIAADDSERFKPFPDPYLQAARAIRQPSKNCLVVENAPAGIQSALAAKMLCIAISSTLPPEKLSKAHLIFSSLEDLIHFFDNYNS